MNYKIQKFQDILGTVFVRMRLIVLSIICLQQNLETEVF